MKIPFNEKELEVVATVPGFGGSTVEILNYPINNFELLKHNFVDKNPQWITSGSEAGFFCPSVIPDHVARGFCFEAFPTPREKFGGKDMFGLDWVYVDVAGGSMSDGHFFDDANDWKEYVKMPDIDAWDWEGSAEANKAYLESGPKTMWFLNGCWFERMISFMTFEGAAMALLDEDQEDAVKEMLHELTDLYIRIVDKCMKHYPALAGFCIHDDWGSQMAPFFSDDVAENFFLPEMKRFVDHIHSYGKYIEIHSCGHVEDRCHVFVKAGFDVWCPMAMNDTAALFEKYGDKIVINVVVNEIADPATATEEDYIEAAKRFAAKFAKPNKPCQVSFMYSAPGQITPTFTKELYKQSRILCTQE